MLRRAEKYNFDLRNASDTKKRSFLNGRWEGYLYVGVVYGTLVDFMYYAEFNGDILKLYKKGPGDIDELDKQSKELIYSGDYSFGRNTRGSSWLNSYIKIDDSQIVPIVFDGNDAQLYLEKSKADDNEEMLTLTEVKLVVQYGTAYVNMDKKTDYVNMDTTTMTQHSISQKVTNDKATQQLKVINHITKVTNDKTTQQFKTVIIGNQIWMAENLNLDVGSGCWCYENKQANCNKYGRLYTWEAAKRAANKIEGWHLPTDNEWEQLENYLGGRKVAGRKLKSTGGWVKSGNGNNSSGFSALPSGCRSDRDGFYGIGYYAFFWTATVCDSSYAWKRELHYDSSEVYRYGYNKDGEYSVRLVKD